MAVSYTHLDVYKRQGYDSAHYEYIWDRVFLLDVQQLKTVNDNLNGYHIANIFIMGTVIPLSLIHI